MFASKSYRYFEKVEKSLVNFQEIIEKFRGFFCINFRNAFIKIL